MANISNWVGIGADILKKYQQAESSGNDPGSFGMDQFINEFEDEFPSDPEENNGQGLPTYSPEANRAAEQKPWGKPFGNRPKIHELNQPQSAQALGWRILDIYLNRDQKWDFSRIAGTPSELRLLIQLTQIIRRAAGQTINFEEWFEAWSNGFPSFSAEGRELGNYPLSLGIPGTPAKKWERLIDRQLRPKYREWTSNQDKANFGYRVIEYFPKGFDNPSHVLGGRDIDLINQIIEIENTKATEINFEAWFEEWSHGFPSFSAEERELGNYPLSLSNSAKRWDRLINKQVRPKYREWASNQDKGNFGYRVIEYFPKGFGDKSYILSGKPPELISHIIQIEYHKATGEDTEITMGDIRVSKPGKLAVGHPLVILQFKEILPQGDQNRPLYFEKSFRLMKLTDSPFESRFDKISKQDISALASRIALNFKDDFRWKYGRKCVSYKGAIASSQGINGWAYCATQADGIALFQKIAACAGVELNKKDLRYSEAVDESAFSTTPTEYQLLGRTEKTPIHRKKCDASFYDAVLILPFSNQKIPLVRGSLVIAP